MNSKLKPKPKSKPKSQSKELAVIQIGGSQQIVSEGESITTQLPQGSTGPIEVNEVLLIAKGDDIKIGKPYIDGALVKMNIIEQKRGRKLRVLKYKSKTRYRKTIGFRPVLTTLKVEKIILA